MPRTLVLVATAVAVMAAVLTVTSAAAAAGDGPVTTPRQAPDSERPAVFCSRTQVQETAVRQRLLDSGQLMVSTHVLTSLRVGETVCISAALPEPEPLPPADPTAGEARLVNMMHNENDDDDVAEKDEAILAAAGAGLSDAGDVPPVRAGPAPDQGPPKIFSTTYKSADKGANQPADIPGSQPGDETVDLAADRSTDQPADRPAALGWSGRRRQAREARLPVRLPVPATAPGRMRRVLLRPSDSQSQQRRLKIQLTVESVQHRHAITASYRFSDPQLGVTCSCACASLHTCTSCGPLCVSKVSLSPAADCQGSFLGSARTCCELKVRPGRTFQAVRLHGGVTLLRLRVAVTEEGGDRPANTETQTVEAQLGEDLRLDLNATQLRLSSAARAGGAADLSRGWYVLHQDQLYQPLSINQLNEYSLHKLGWLKRRGDEHLMPSTDRLAAAVHITTESCTEQRFQVQGDLLLDSTLPQLGPPLAGMTVAQRTPTQLRLTPERPGRPLLLGLDLRHLQKLRYLVHRARLADFDGELRVDARGAVLAELRLFNGSGVQHGSVQVSYGSSGPPPALYRFSLVAERRLRLRLPVALGPDQSTAEMCLRPEGGQEAALCRQLPISRQPRERLHRDTGPDTQLTVDGQTNSINNMERFLRALNPATWLQSGGSWSTAFGAIVDIILVIIAITIICKCISCCRAACCCCRRRNQKA